MPSSNDFWHRLFMEGRITVEGPPPWDVADDGKVHTLLERYFEDYRLTIAGPPLSFDWEIAGQAARLVEWAAWYLVSHAGTDADLERDVALPCQPNDPAQHLSADLVLHYLPYIYRRARTISPGDRLPTVLAEILRRWPLSGVLADLPDGPASDLDFGGHAGLLLLYAERLAENFKPAWIPRGIGGPYLNLVWSELEKDLALLCPSLSFTAEARGD